MPPDFHSSKSFKNLLSLARESLRKRSTFDGKKIDSPLLLLGLAYREISRGIEIEPGAPTEYPDQLVHSSFGIDQLDEIQKLLKEVSVPLEI